MRFFAITCCNVFNVWSMITLLLPVWCRDAKSLDTPEPFTPKSLIRKDKTCDSLAGCKVLKLSSLVEVYHLSFPHCPCQEISPASYSQPHLNRACLSSPRRLCFSSFPWRYYISLYSHRPTDQMSCPKKEQYSGSYNLAGVS